MGYQDHRRLGRQLGIFTTDELCGTGLPLWLPAGATVRAELERFVVELERRNGYQHVYTPELAKRELYERSGHWEHFHHDMYPPMQRDAEQMVLRPMNCPHHILVFRAERRRIRDLPWRVAELGTMFRNERSGVVGGLSRVRQMTLNDGHVFCAPDQLEAEISNIIAMVEEAYRTLAIPPPRYRLSLRDEQPKFVRDDELWRRSEAVLRSALRNMDLSYDEGRGEAAFYGPKIDLQVRDAHGREETLSTVQVDFHLPARFDLEAHDGTRRMQPVMVHRSVVSTMERMVAHLLEVHDGALPVWLAPSQVRILPIFHGAVDYSLEVRARCRATGLRADVDDRESTLDARIRAAQRDRIPYIAVVGRREVNDSSVAVRLRDGRQLDPMPLQQFVALVTRAAETRVPGLLGDDPPR
jgi:threonyl-tRNA synthetase